VFNGFPTSKRVHKLKQCANLILHDENYTSVVASLLVHKMGREGRGGALIPNGGGRLFLISAHRREAYSKEAIVQIRVILPSFHKAPARHSGQTSAHVRAMGQLKAAKIFS